MAIACTQMGTRSVFDAIHAKVIALAKRNKKVIIWKNLN
jgi:hypothetical protein